MNNVFFVTGASGAGKTTAVKNIEKTHSNEFHFCYFDSVGVPSSDERRRQFGGGEEWQRITAENWVRDIKDKFIESKTTILDGQIRPSYIDDACAKYGIVNYKVITLDCSDEVRKRRLIERGNFNLVSEQLMSWAKYLRDESASRDYDVIDNSNMSQVQCSKRLLALLLE